MYCPFNASYIHIYHLCKWVTVYSALNEKLAFLCLDWITPAKRQYCIKYLAEKLLQLHLLLASMSNPFIQTPTVKYAIAFLIKLCSPFGTLADKNVFALFGDIIMKAPILLSLLLMLVTLSAFKKLLIPFILYS